MTQVTVAYRGEGHAEITIERPKTLNSLDLPTLAARDMRQRR